MSMSRNRTLIAAALLLSLLSPARATEADEEGARNHGYETAALEVACAGMLTVTNPRLRAQLDRKYREPDSRWRDQFLEAYENVASRAGGAISTGVPCVIAGNSRWMKLTPAARDGLSINIRKSVEERKQRLGIDE
jgi:hypothetical protein